MRTTTTTRADRVWAALEPLGYERYVDPVTQEQVEFYAPGTDDGYLAVTAIGALSLYMRHSPAWAAGLRALADVLEGETA